MFAECPVCQRQVPPRDVSERSLLARCRACDSVFDVSAHVLGAGDRQRDGDRQTERQQPELPVGFTVQRTPGAGHDLGGPYRGSGVARDDLEVEWRWRHRKHRWFLRVTWLWLGFVALWYLTAGIREDRHMALFSTLHLLAGLAMLYVAVAFLKNRTHITLRGDTLEVNHQPLPWPGNQRIPVTEIAQLYCREELIYRKKRDSIVSYRVHIRLRPGGDVTLIRGLPDVEQALYLEQQIESCLGIVDVAVPGELDKG